MLPPSASVFGRQGIGKIRIKQQVPIVPFEEKPALAQPPEMKTFFDGISRPDVVEQYFVFLKWNDHEGLRMGPVRRAYTDMDTVVVQV